MVVIILDIASLKECMVFYFLWKFSVELVFERECKFSRSLLHHLAVPLIILKFYVDLLSRSVFQ